MAVARLSFVWVALAALMVGLPEAHAQFHLGYQPWKTDGPFQWVNLTWSGTQGGLGWGAEGGEDDRPVDPYTADDYSRAGTVRGYTGVDLSPPARTFEFTSAAAPATYVLNVSRPILFEFFLKYGAGGNPCGSYQQDPEAHITLLLGDKILAGAASHAILLEQINWVGHPNQQAPTNPAGYGACRFSAGAEAAIIPAGAVLKLQITWFRQSQPYALGLAGDHRSSIRLPLLPADDAIFRYPELAPPESDESGPGSGGGAFFMAGFGAAGLALVGVPRRGRIGVLLCVLLVAASLGGCLGSGKTSKPGGTDDGLGGHITNTFVDDPGGLVSGPNGSIVGQVHDDIHVAIPGAHVAVLGHEQFAETDAKGRFTFLNLDPGNYRLRFTKVEYKSFEGNVEVKSGLVSRPSIMMYLENPKVRDLRPHSHDYWEADEVDRLLVNEPLIRPCPAADDCLPNYEFIIPAVKDQFRTVLPGTSEVEVTFTFEAATIGQDKLGLMVRHNADPPWVNAPWILNWTFFAPRASGTPFRIATTWEMTDPGHQFFSTWQFQWYEGRAPPSDTASAITGAYLDPLQGALPHVEPRIDVKIVAKRGQSLPLEPAHPNHWGDNTKVVVLKDGLMVLYPSNQFLVAAPGTPPSASTCTSGTQYDCTKVRPQMAKPGLVVPESTAWLEVVVRQTRDTQPATTFHLYAKPGNVPFNRDVYGLDGFVKIEPVSGGNWERTVYRIPVAKDQWDFLYARQSAWQFTMVPDDVDLWWADAQAHPTGCAVVVCPGSTAGMRMLYFRVEATAYQTAMPG